MKIESLKETFGKGFKSNGDVTIDWIVTYTEDGKEWISSFFDDIDSAREYAHRVCFLNKGNDNFSHYAKRSVVVSSDGFLDNAVRPSDIAPAPSLWLEKHFSENQMSDEETVDDSSVEDIAISAANNLLESLRESSDAIEKKNLALAIAEIAKAIC